MGVNLRPALTALVACALPALAQQATDPAPGAVEADAVESIRRYTVELIVFAYHESGSSGNEIWLPDEPAAEYAYPDTGGFRPRDESLTEIDTPAVPRRYVDVALTPLAPGEAMNAIYDKLGELDAYEPILRTAWTQRTVEKTLTAPINLRSVAEVPAWIDGTIMLYRGRYLHLVLDLSMDANREPGPLSGESLPAGPRYGDARTWGDRGISDGGEAPAVVRYRISEDRIMRNGDIRYFDHPKFGAIARVARVEQPDKEIFDDTDDLLPGGLLSE